MPNPEYHVQFFTATILEWRYLLKPDKYKDIIIDSLRFLVNTKRVVIYAFVIMNNHIHIVWQIQAGYRREDVQRDFLKFTANKIKRDLEVNHPNVFKKFKVNTKDRSYQFWERNALSIDLYTHDVFIQKIKYIHENPIRARLCTIPEDYKYSSANFYYTGEDERFEFISHYAD